MIVLSPHEAGQVLGLDAFRDPVVGISIDSRTIKPGDLFVALTGQRHDGHQYVRAAFAAGASAAVVEASRWQGFKVASSAEGTDAAATAELGPVYEVSDTLAALGALARAVRRKSRAAVFAVTGSVGKTTTKDLLASMLAEVCVVTATCNNQNNEIGVPLTLLSVQPESEAVVVEMAMRGRGQIASLAQIAEPDIGVITNIHPVHLELLGSLEAIAQAKVELLAFLPPGGAAVVPWGCRALDKALAAVPTRARVVRFSTDPGCQEAEVVGWCDSRGGERARRLVIRFPGGEAEVEMEALPPYVLENVAAAAAACYAGGFPVEACLRGVRKCLFSDHRWQVHRVGGLVIIDDTYNANPAAMKAAIDGLVRIACEEQRRPVAVLGDMLELGPDSVSYHEEVGAYAARAGVAVLWGIGTLAAHTVSSFLKTGKTLAASAGKIGGHIACAEESSAIWRSLSQGDVVLFKASRAMRFERLVEEAVSVAMSGGWGLPTEGDKPNSHR